MIAAISYFLCSDFFSMLLVKYGISWSKKHLFLVSTRVDPNCLSHLNYAVITMRIKHIVLVTGSKKKSIIIIWPLMASIIVIQYLEVLVPFLAITSADDNNMGQAFHTNAVVSKNFSSSATDKQILSKKWEDSRL